MGLDRELGPGSFSGQKFYTQVSSESRPRVWLWQPLDLPGDNTWGVIQFLQEPPHRGCGALEPPELGFACIFLVPFATDGEGVWERKGV